MCIYSSSNKLKISGGLSVVHVVITQDNWFTAYQLMSQLKSIELKYINFNHHYQIKLTDVGTQTKPKNIIVFKKRI